jgi:16S rRNA G527 N7-methylase RsmG
MTDTAADEALDMEMVKVLEGLLERNEEITARAVARLHPRISAASSITRSESRAKLLAQYQDRQREIRGWHGKLSKLSKEKAAFSLAEKDERIAELERQVTILTASHVAMIRAVGEMGGFSAWRRFFERTKGVRDSLIQMGAVPDDLVRNLSQQNQQGAGS